VLQTTLKIAAPYKYIGIVYNLLEQHGGMRSGEDFQSDGSVVLHVSVIDSVVDALALQLKDATSGTVECTVV
jgi:putative IMPACT (imprinted ancient) family translation regulator